jgi:hypothetical protein
MSDGISEARRGTYFRDRSKGIFITNNQEEIDEKEKMERLRIIRAIQDEPDMERAQKILTDFKEGVPFREDF